FNGKSNIKGRINSYGINPKAILPLNHAHLMELKEPGDLSKGTSKEEKKARLFKELIDPFCHIMGNEDNESGWMNLRVNINDDNQKLDGNLIEKTWDDADRVSEFMILNES